MTTKKMLHNANKVAYLVKRYPEHTLAKIIGLLSLPSVDINAAIWYATELGFITEPDKETQKVSVGPNFPQIYEFDERLQELMDALQYCFKQLARKENDLEENYVSNWTFGYEGHDVLIALGLLCDENILASYTLTDPNDLKSTYIFYTLYENREQMWGRKQFKQQPTGEEVAEPIESDQTTSETTTEETTNQEVDPDQQTLV